MFRAFADPTRLRLLHVLQDGEYCVSEIMAALRLPQAKVSRHLTYLRRAGLVVPRREGLRRFYRLTDARAEFHRKLLDCLGCCFESIPGLAADRRRAVRLAARRPCCPELARPVPSKKRRARGCGTCRGGECR